MKGGLYGNEIRRKFERGICREISGQSKISRFCEEGRSGGVPTGGQIVQSGRRSRNRPRPQPSSHPERGQIDKGKSSGSHQRRNPRVQEHVPRDEGSREGREGCRSLPKIPFRQ